ncbi:hypothetical protein AB0E10_01580 [Streptomyces sp. NPDC048045]|uniref:hypothetical protein n=1 Tax=Streptomyces sp. NPDC048045 TaxID=3154710 RepID=UPI0034145D3B
MGDTGRRSSVPRKEPTPMSLSPPPTRTRRLALYTLAVCVLAVAAAVVSFVQGSWLGIVWVLLAGLSSNMTWYYIKRGRSAGGPGKSVTG